MMHPQPTPPASESGRRRLRRESIADQVAAHIRRLIVSGELANGERIRQDDIASQLGVSRIPVREAIIALDREGWVRFESNRGASVAALEVDDIRDHFELRGLVFGLLARRVAQKATDDEVDEFAALLQSVIEAVELEDFAALNDRFISRLLKVADSPRLTAALKVTPAILPTGFFEFVPAGREIQQRGYTAFVQALKSRAPDSADEALVEALRQQGEAAAAAFAATGVAEGTGAVGPPSYT